MLLSIYLQLKLPVGISGALPVSAWGEIQTDLPYQTRVEKKRKAR